MKYLNFCILLLCFFCSSACEKALDQLKEDTLEGFQFEVSTGVLHQPLTLQVLDELTGEPAEGVNLELLSSDFSKLYTNSGSKSLRIQGGMLTLGTLKREAPNESAPRKMRFRFQGPGYLNVEEEYLLNDTLGQLATVWMRPMRASNHIDVLEKTLPSERSTTMTYSSPNQLINLSIDPNVEFQEGKSSITGNLTLKLIAIPGTSANKNYLESTLTRAAFRKADGSLGKLNLNPVSLIDFQVKSGSETADHLSFPANLNIPLSTDLFNPLTQAKIKAGDVIPAFWQNPDERIWHAKAFATVSNRNGKLEASMPLVCTGRWALGFMELWPEEKISELCQVFIRVQSDVPDTLKGVYYRGTTPVRYLYTTKASLNFMQVFPSCRSGQGFDLDALVRNVRAQTRSFFLQQDSAVFGNVNFNPQVSVFVIQPLPICAEYSFQEKNNIPISINADEATEGWLYYQIGSSSGYRFMRLNKGINNLQVAYPRNPLFTPGGFYGTQAQFIFYYEEGCQLRSSTRSFPVCEVLSQGALLRVRPSSGSVLSSVDLSIDASCGGVHQPAIRPSLPVFYRSACNTGMEMPYKKLGEIKAGTLLANLPLRLGERYDFKIQYGQELQEFQGIRLNADSLSFGKFYSLSKKGRIKVHFGAVELPEGVCSLVK